MPRYQGGRLSTSPVARQLSPGVRGIDFEHRSSGQRNHNRTVAYALWTIAARMGELPKPLDLAHAAFSKSTPNGRPDSDPSSTSPGQRIRPGVPGVARALMYKDLVKEKEALILEA
jgi:hypothetical protein